MPRPVPSSGSVRLAGLCVVGAALFAASGCSSDGARVRSGQAASAAALDTSRPAPSPGSHYAQQFLRIVDPAYTAIDTITGVPTQAELTAVAATIRTADRELLQATWPSAAITADVEAMVRSHGPVIDDLLTNDGSHLPRDAAAAKAAGDVVRAELGLPPTT